MKEDNINLNIDDLKKDKNILSQIEKNKSEAENLLRDEDKMDEFLNKLENKLLKIPKIGEYLSDLPVFISLIKSYVNKEYTEIPMGSLIAIISALIYFLSPIDVIPDIVPGVGYLDDAAVVAIAYGLVHDDIEDYKLWRERNKIKKDGQ